MCFTGTLYVFQKKITQWVDRDKCKLKTVGKVLPLATRKKTVEKERTGKVVSVIIPQTANEARTFTLAVKDEKKPDIARA